MTDSATKFVTPLSFESITHGPVLTNLWAEQPDMDISHIRLASNAAIMAIVPATAQVIAACALGLAGDALSATMLATRSPLLFAPAMNSAMWANAATQQNVQTLRRRGVEFVGPVTGYLAEGSIGEGRLADPNDIVAAIVENLGRSADFAGQHVIVTAGPTREAIDPVRYISNRSSGKMGYAIAERAAVRGAKVSLISGPVDLVAPSGVAVTRITTSDELFAAVQAQVSPGCTLIMAAAVADYKPLAAQLGKIKRDVGELQLRLTPTIDVLATLERPDCMRVVAFAAETENVLPQAQAKLAAKRADLLVANDVSEPGAGFDSDTNHVWLCRPGKDPEEVPMSAKRQVADKILDALHLVGLP
jgi:phosphopantothenoylcysteine decarboxylase/phosphopantothenate--cysteine ligase